MPTPYCCGRRMESFTGGWYCPTCRQRLDPELKRAGATRIAGTAQPSPSGDTGPRMDTSTHTLQFTAVTNLNVSATCSCGRWSLSIVPLLGDTEVGVRDFVRESFALHHRSATRLICDGCAVWSPHEHRCHEGDAQVKGEPTGRACECPECHPAPELLPGPVS